MTGDDFLDSPKLSMPERREELILFLKELEMNDPRVAWHAETKRGLASSIDEVFHFFFDDNDFDEDAIGVTLLSRSEVASIQSLKTQLEAILESVGDEDDDVFVEHPRWSDVPAAASKALGEIEA